MALAEQQAQALFAAAREVGLAVAAPVAPQSQHLVVNGFRLHYLDWGTAGRQPMLLLHGGSQTAHSWDFFSIVMREDYHVIALDQRGHGDSEWAPDGDYSREAHRRDIGGFVDALGLRDFVLVGLSMGGLNAITYTARHPERVARLVIVDVGPEVRREGAESIRRFVSGPDELDSIEAFVERARQFNPRRAPHQLRNSLLHNLRQLPNGKWTWKYDRRFRGSARPVERVDSAELWGYVRALRCPTLIVRGAQSDILAEATAHKMVVAIAGSRLATVENAGHTVPGDNPVGFEAAVRSFLGSP